MNTNASTSAKAAKDPIVWIDCEMTGLDLEADALIEVAVVVTDSELRPLDAGIDLGHPAHPGCGGTDG